MDTVSIGEGKTIDAATKKSGDAMRSKTAMKRSRGGGST